MYFDPATRSASRLPSRESARSSAHRRRRAGVFQTRYRPCLERLEDRTLLSSGFYNYDIIAQTGKAGLSGILQDSSINDLGKVAFVGQYQDGSGNLAGEGIFVGDGSSLNDITFGSYAADPNRTFGPAVQINNNDFVAAVDRYSPGDTQWRLRTWNADGKTNANGTTWVTYAIAGSPPVSGYNFDSIASAVSLSNNGNIAYAAFSYAANQWQLRMQNDPLPDSLDVPAAELTAPQSLRPMAASGAGNLGYMVVRDGSTATSPIVLYGNVLGGAIFSVPIANTGSPYRFSALGQSPGISDDGRVVVFYGVDSDGPGIFASVSTASHGRQLVRIASASASGPIRALEPDERVGVNATELTQGAVTITYVGKDANGNKGVYASRLTFVAPANDATNFKDPTSFVVSAPFPVLQAGDAVPGLGTVQDVNLYDPINNVGFGQIAIWVQASGGTGIVRASSPGLSAIANTVHYQVTGAAISAAFQPQFYQPGNPPSASPMTLAEAAAAWGVDHFNWLQYVTALPATWQPYVASPIAFTDPGAGDNMPAIKPDSNPPVTQDNPAVPDGTPVTLQPISLQAPGLLDPLQQQVLGGETYVFQDTASGTPTAWDYSYSDNHPGYYNDASTPNLPANLKNVDLADQMFGPDGNTAGTTAATALRFFDQPEQAPGTIPSGQYLSFATALVGVRADGSILQFPKGLGVSFTWRSNATKSGQTGGGLLGEVSAAGYSFTPTTTLPPVAAGGVFDAESDNATPPAPILTLASIDNQAVTPGTNVRVTVTATDPFPGATVAFSLAAGAPLSASIDPNTGVFAWTPTAAQAGQVYTITVNATDNSTPALAASQSFIVNVLNKLSVTAVTELAPPIPGPLQVAVDFNEAVEPALGQNTANYKIAPEGGSSLPIVSAVYTDNGSQHQVVLTIPAETNVTPGFYNVYIDAANLVATNGDQGEPKADQLWVDVTSENTLKPITVQPDGTLAVSGPGKSLGYGAPQTVLGGNFAGNGRTDLIIVTNARHEETDAKGNDVVVYDPILLLTNNGDGTYAPPVPLGLGGDIEIESIASVDWNHDGFPDLIVGTANPPFDESGDAASYSYYVLLNDGHGNFTNAPETPIPVSTSTSLAPMTVVDLSGDGQYDIIHPGPTTANGDRTVEVIGKDPYLGYTPRMELPVGISSDNDPLSGGNLVYLGQFAFGDLNGDGTLDIVTGLTGYYADYPNFSLITSTSTGYATGQQVQDTNGSYNTNDDFVPYYHPGAIGVGKFSGRAYNDIAAVYAGAIQIYQNDGKGTFTDPEPFPLASGFTAIAATFADLNDDGIPDVVAIEQPYNANGESGEPLYVWTLMANTHGGFIPTSPAPIPLAASDDSLPTAMSIADVNGDGNADVILGSSQSGEVRLAINDGTGTMRPPTQPLPYIGSENGYSDFNETRIPGISQPQQVFADFTSSGQLGFVTIGPGGLDVYVGQSVGTFKHTATLPDPFSTPIVWLKVGDLNNDGIPDILDGDGNNVAVYLGNGDGTFRQAPTFIDQASGYSIGNITLADVNNDGNLDAVATLNGAFGVLFGHGKGDLTFNLNTVVPAAFPSRFVLPSAVLGDFNGDGKLDLLVPARNSSNGNITLTDYLGNGNGIFTPGPIIYGGASQIDTQDLVGDVNGDGKLDLVSINGTTASIYLGDGHGGFQLVSTIQGLTMGSYALGPVPPSDVVLGDFNGDEKLDLAVAYYDSTNPNVVQIYPGDGTGNFGTPQSVTVGTNPFTLVSIPRTPFLTVGSFAVTDHGPVANNAQATDAYESSVSIPVLASATDVDNAPLTIAAVSAPAHGTAYIDPSTDTVVYSSARGFSGTDTFTYTVEDPAGVTSTATVTVTVLGFTIAPAGFPGAQIGVQYNEQLTADGGTSPYTFAVTSGALPPGLVLSGAGVLSGTATTAETSSFILTVTDSVGRQTSESLSIIAETPISELTVNLPPARAGSSFTSQLDASGGTAPFTFAITSGALPPGLALSASGRLSGAPTVAGISHFAITITDGTGATTTVAQSITVAPLTVTATQLAPADPGPLQIALDFGGALQPASAQTVSNYQIAAAGGAPLPIQSAVYTDNGTYHRVVLTLAPGTTVMPSVYNVSIKAASLLSATGTPVEQTTDQLWVDITSTNTLQQITTEPGGDSSVYGPGELLGYGAPEYVLAGNFAGNGRTDLVIVTNSRREETDAKGNDVFVSDPILLLKNNGGGSYAPPVPIALGGQTAIESITSVDWNHDGYPDLVVGTANPPFDEYGDPSSYSYYVLLNDGHGNFTNAPETPIPVPGYITATAVADLNNNGQYEIIRVAQGLEIIGKDPNLGYTPQMELTGSPGNLPPIFFADFNGDGRPDIITSNLTVFMSTPTGYAAGQQLSGFNALAVAAGNFTGTGYNDLATVSSEGVRIFQNDGKGDFTWFDTPDFQYDYVRAAAFTDLNHDGIPDLVVIIQPLTPDGAENGEPLSVWTLMADGHGGFTPTTPAPIPLATTDDTIPTSMVLADVDGDGNADVILGSSRSGEVRLAINDGTGTMRPPTQPLPYIGSENGYSNFNETRIPGISQPQQVFADFTNSGQPGFVTVGPGGLDVSVGQGVGTFKHTAILPDPFSTPIVWLKVGDLNNDGIPDIVDGDGNNVAVYLGNGDGTFRQAPTFIDQASGYSIGNITLADVNNDGNLDAVATLNGAFGVLFGDGKGDLTFNLNTVVPAALPSRFVLPSAVLGDFNGDGKLDLLVPTRSSSNGTITLTDYLGSGNGTFTPGPIVYSGASQIDTQDLVGDFNGDGKLDFTSINGTTASIYLGDGHGGFQLASTIQGLTMGSYALGPAPPSDVALGDFNGDGKLDLAVAYYELSTDPNVVQLYPGDGTGNFGTPQSVTVGTNPFTLVSIPRTPFLTVGSVTVTGHGPVADNDSATVLSRSSVSIPVLKNDTDADNAPLTITHVSNPAHGAAHLDPSTNTIVYAPASGFSGTDTFTYTIADPAGATSTATVTVTVVAITIAPATLPDPEVGVSYTPQLSATGGTGPYTFAVTTGSLPSGLQLSANGLFSGMASTVGTSDFTITVTDSTGLSEPQEFALIVIPSVMPPTVTADPANATVYATQTVTFTAAASGLPAPVVHWQVSSDGGKTFSTIVGATSENYSFIAQPVVDGNEYQAIFTNQDGSATTTAAMLTVYYSPIIVGQPTSEEVAPGTVIAFNAAAVSNPPVTSVQWQLSTDGGQTFTNFSGATGMAYSIPAQTSDNNDLYRAVFTNRIGTATTNAARLTVQPAPVVTMQPTSQAVVAGAVVTFTAAAAGSAPVSVQWQVSTDAGMTFSPLGGATSDVLAFTASVADNGNEYEAEFTNAFGATTSEPATLHVSGGPSGSINTDTPTLAWTPVAGADHYYLKVSDGNSTVLTVAKVTATTYALTAAQALTPGHSYTWTVTPLSASGKALTPGSSLSFQVQPIGAPTPSAPTGSITADRPTFTWSAVADAGHTAANHFTVQIKDTGTKSVVTIANVTGTTYTLSAALALAPGHNYTWSVTAFSTNGKATAVSGAVALQVLPLGAPTPSSPIDSSATDRPTVAWTSGADTGHTAPDHFVVTVTDKATRQAVKATVTGTSYTLTAAQALTPGHTYLWSVTAVSTNGKVSVAGPIATFSVAPLAAATGLSFTSAGDIFSWQPVPNVGHYALVVQDSVTKATVVNVPSVAGKTNQLTAAQAKALKPGRSYTWYVTAISTNGKTSARSASQQFTL
jgi:hypothetical protein